MAKKKSTAKSLSFVRVANSWMVGRNVNRVVPLYALHNFVARDFERYKGTQAIKNLAINASVAVSERHLAGRFSLLPNEIIEVQRCVHGLLSPDRRVFRDKKNGVAGKNGALFPVVGGLLANTGSDDGLGRRFRELMDCHDTDWRQRLKLLFAPDQPNDPVTGFAWHLLGNSAGEEKGSEQGSPRTLAGLDLQCARFVDNLIEGRTDARRVSVIRRLAIGVYFAATMRLVAGPVERHTSRLPLVWAYAGLPPGVSGDPLVRATSRSYTQWISQSWDSHAHHLYANLRSVAIPRRTPKDDILRRCVHQRISEQLEGQQKEIEKITELFDSLVQGEQLSKEWCRAALQHDAVGFTKAEFARRVRSLGANVGFVAPNRGLMPRLVLDTPLLDVLVKGVAGRAPIAFLDFVDELAERFGLVVGVGNDGSIVDAIQQPDADAADSYDLLSRNQEMLRERLLRTGLARAYSDSHTEVVSHE